MGDITLIRTMYRCHVSWDVIFEFEEAILHNSKWNFVRGPSKFEIPIYRRLEKIVRPSKKVFYSNKQYFVICFFMPKALPYFLLSCKLKMLWIYDAWESLFDLIELAIRKYDINILFTSSLQSSEYFNRLGIDNFRSYWVPEGITPNNYKQKDYSARKIDVLQFGRRWDWYHGKINEFCERKNMKYLYEKRAGAIVFSSREEFIHGLANSKISICVPSAITHPERTGYVSTMTARYLQSMASKCLVLGKMPEDMKLLFDYKPMIEIDVERPAEQLEYILNNYDKYVDLIEKNFEYIKENHQWTNRICTIEKYVNKYNTEFVE